MLRFGIAGLVFYWFARASASRPRTHRAPSMSRPHYEKLIDAILDALGSTTFDVTVLTNNACHVSWRLDLEHGASVLCATKPAPGDEPGVRLEVYGALAGDGNGGAAAISNRDFGSGLITSDMTYSRVMTVLSIFHIHARQKIEAYYVPEEYPLVEAERP